MFPTPYFPYSLLKLTLWGPYSITNVTFLSRIFILNCRNIRLSNLARCMRSYLFPMSYYIYYIENLLYNNTKCIIEYGPVTRRTFFRTERIGRPRFVSWHFSNRIVCVVFSPSIQSWIELFCFENKKINARVQSTNSCSSADETEDGELDPDVKAQREKERRQANNARERWELSCLVLWPIFLYVFQYCF